MLAIRSHCDWYNHDHAGWLYESKWDRVASKGAFAIGTVSQDAGRILLAAISKGEDLPSDGRADDLLVLAACNYHRSEACDGLGMSARMI